MNDDSFETVNEITKVGIERAFNVAAIELLKLYEAMRQTFGAEMTLECVAELHKTAKRLALDERKSKIWTPGAK